MTNSFAASMKITAEPFEVACFVLHMLLIGVAEEILFRGILQNAVMDFIGYDSVKKVRTGIIIAGSVFGFVHITNAFIPGISFASAAMQALGVATAGILDDAVYYRSKKNIWLLILMHAFNDGCILLVSGSLSGKGLTDILGHEVGVASFIAPITFILVDMWVLRKKRLSECVNDTKYAVAM